MNTDVNEPRTEDRFEPKQQERGRGKTKGGEMGLLGKCSTILN